MTYFSVFHQQDMVFRCEAKFHINRKKGMETDEPGNCISDNYNLFWFTGYIIYWLTLLWTLLVSYSKPRASKFWDQAGRFY